SGGRRGRGGPDAPRRATSGRPPCRRAERTRCLRGSLRPLLAFVPRRLLFLGRSLRLSLRLSLRGLFLRLSLLGLFLRSDRAHLGQDLLDPARVLERAILLEPELRNPAELQDAPEGAPQE